MSFDNLIQSVANRNSIGKLDFRNDRYYLTIDGRIEVACFQSKGKFYLHGILASLPPKPDDQQKLLTELLQKNLGLMMTQRVSLCMEPDTDELALSTTRSALGLTEDIIEESLAEFANNYEYFLGLMVQDTQPAPVSPVMIMP